MVITLVFDTSISGSSPDGSANFIEKVMLGIKLLKPSFLLGRVPKRV